MFSHKDIQAHPSTSGIRTSMPGLIESSLVNMWVSGEHWAMRICPPWKAPTSLILVEEWSLLCRHWCLSTFPKLRWCFFPLPIQRSTLFIVVMVVSYLIQLTLDRWLYPGLLAKSYLSEIGGFCLSALSRLNLAWLLDQLTTVLASLLHNPSENSIPTVSPFGIEMISLFSRRRAVVPPLSEFPDGNSNFKLLPGSWVSP
jgi:hypothetical protein